MTVGELKKRITPAEVRGWVLYEREFGPLHLGLRIERAIAQVFAPFFKDKSGKQLTMQDLMTWPTTKEKEEEQFATPGDIMNLLKSTTRKPKENGHG